MDIPNMRVLPDGEIRETEVRIVPDSPCPGCGAVWGHSDKSLDFPNRPKVCDADGTWWWRCYNPACDVAYYDPGSVAVERVVA